MIKIDRSWTTRLAREGGTSRLARGVLRLATTTGLVVVAEGIETGAERDALLAEGCLLGQGYLYARPEPMQQLTARLTGAGEPAADARALPVGGVGPLTGLLGASARPSGAPRAAASQR